MLKTYEVELEIAGPLAMFTRPDTGGTPTSYDVPTWSAAKSLFESIAFFSDGAAWICPTKLEICRRVGGSGGRVRYQRYTTNYGGPLRKASLFGKGTFSGGSSMQLFASVLYDVCYRLYGTVVGPTSTTIGVNARHHLYDLFNRRLKQGQCFRTPSLGWSEFTCSYWGPIRQGVTEPDTDFHAEIASLLVSVWHRASNGRYRPLFDQNVKIVGGTLNYRSPDELLDEGNRETNQDA